MADNDKVPSEEGQTENKQSSEGIGSGSDSKETGEALSQVPDNLRGKSEAELAKMYQNLEKKLGEQSSEIQEARQIKQQADVLVKAIGKDPKRFQQVRGWVDELYGVNTGDQGENAQNGESGEGSGESAAQTSKSDDTRRALQNQTLENFYKKHGITELPEEQQKEERQKIAAVFKDLYDPKGDKPILQVLDEVPLDRLSGALDNAYKVANFEKVAGSGQSSSDEELNRQAAIGSLTSAGSKGEDKVTLTSEEREVAKKLGVSPEKYAKRKQEAQG